MPLADELQLHRLQYRQGQTLLGRDLDDQAAATEQLRWWHNRAMHGAYGVVAPSQPVTAGPGAGQVTISPFVAYDAFGRELILQRPRQMRLPPRPAPASARAPAPAPTARDPEPTFPGFPHGPHQPQSDFQVMYLVACRATGHDCDGRLSFAWVSRYDRLPGAVPLADAVSDKGGEYTLPSRWFPPSPRALSRPRIATGRSPRGGGGWQVAPPEGGFPTRLSAWFDLRVDTSAAGFTQPPCYFAWLESRTLDMKGAYIACDSVVGSSLRAFTFRVVIRFSLGDTGALPFGDDQAGAEYFRRLAADADLSVFWIGLQPAPADGDNEQEDTHGSP
jgi:hypothetical protein